MVNITIFLEFSNTVVSLQKPTISSLATTLIAENNQLRLSACFYATRSSIQRTSFYSEETMSVRRSIESMASTMSVGADTQSDFGKSLVMFSTASQ